MTTTGLFIVALAATFAFDESARFSFTETAGVSRSVDGSFSFVDAANEGTRRYVIPAWEERVDEREKIVFRYVDGLDLILTPTKAGLTIIDVDDANKKIPLYSKERVFETGDIQLIIPQEIDGRQITEIGARAFFNVDVVASVAIPDSVVKIGREAFSHCDSLRDVALPKHLQAIEYGTFGDCKSIENFVIPDDVVEIGGAAFHDCVSLKNITLGTSIRRIGEVAFANCFRLERIDLFDSIETIGRGAFHGCRSLTSIKIPSSLEILCGGSVVGLKDKEFVVPDHIKKIEGFGLCSPYLEKIVIGKNVEEIAPGAFMRLRNLLSVTIVPGNENFRMEDDALFTKDGKRLVATFARELKIRDLPQGLVRIDDFAFIREQPTVVVIPESVREIGDSAFRMEAVKRGERATKTSLSIKVDDDNPNFKSVDGALLTKDGKIYLQAPLGREGEYEIPTGVETIKEEAFKGSDFEKITVPGSVKVFSFSIFSKSPNLKEVVFKKGVEDVLLITSSGGVQTIYLPQSVKQITPPTDDQSYNDLWFELFSLINESEKTTFRVHKGSYAERWARETGRKYETID